MSLRREAAQTIEISGVALNRGQKHRVVDELVESASRHPRFRRPENRASIPDASIPRPETLRRLTSDAVLAQLSRQFHRPVAESGNIAAAAHQIVDAADASQSSEDFRYLNDRAQLHLHKGFDHLSPQEKLFFAGRYVCLAIMHAELFNDRPFQDTPDSREPVDSNLEAFLMATLYREDLLIRPLVDSINQLHERLGFSLPFHGPRRRAGIEGRATSKLMGREGVIGVLNADDPAMAITYMPEAMVRQQLDQQALSAIAYHENLHSEQYAMGKTMDQPVERHIDRGQTPTCLEVLTDLEAWLMPQLVNPSGEIQCTFPISSRAGAVELYRATLDLYDNVGPDAFRSLLVSARHGKSDGTALIDDETGKPKLPRIREFYDRHLGQGSFDERMSKHRDFIVSVEATRIWNYLPQLSQFPPSIRALPSELIGG